MFHNANLFGSYIIHILYTGCAEIKKKNSDAKGLTGIITECLQEISKNSRCHGLDSNWTPAQFKPEALPLEPTSSDS